MQVPDVGQVAEQATQRAEQAGGEVELRHVRPATDAVESDRAIVLFHSRSAREPVEGDVATENIGVIHNDDADVGSGLRLSAGECSGVSFDPAR